MGRGIRRTRSAAMRLIATLSGSCFLIVRKLSRPVPLFSSSSSETASTSASRTFRRLPLALHGFGQRLQRAVLDHSRGTLGFPGNLSYLGVAHPLDKPNDE